MGADTIISGVVRPSAGLVELLNSKATGQAPNELLQAARPTVELSPYLLAGVGLETLAGTRAAAAVFTGYDGFFAVPDGRIWIPYCLIVRITLGVGDIWQGGLFISAPNGDVVAQNPSTPWAFQTVNSVARQPAIGWEPRQIVLSSGYQFGVHTQVFTNGTGTAALSFWLSYWDLTQGNG